jgi:hypothetical protein
MLPPFLQSPVITRSGISEPQQVFARTRVTLVSDHLARTMSLNGGSPQYPIVSPEGSWAGLFDTSLNRRYGCPFLRDQIRYASGVPVGNGKKSAIRLRSCGFEAARLHGPDLEHMLPEVGVVVWSSATAGPQVVFAPFPLAQSPYLPTLSVTELE